MLKGFIDENDNLILGFPDDTDQPVLRQLLADYRLAGMGVDVDTKRIQHVEIPLEPLGEVDGFPNEFAKQVKEITSDD